MHANITNVCGYTTTQSTRKQRWFWIRWEACMQRTDVNETSPISNNIRSYICMSSLLYIIRPKILGKQNSKKKKRLTIGMPCLSACAKYAKTPPTMTVTIGAMAETQNRFGLFFFYTIQISFNYHKINLISFNHFYY